MANKDLYTFFSKMITNSETQYTDFEKIMLALKMVGKKLRPYFQAYTIVVITSNLIRAILHKPDASSRHLKWAVELSEFDIIYHPWSSIRG